MGVATGTPKYRTPDDFSLRNFHSLDDEARFVANAVSDRWVGGKAAVLRIDNEYGESYAAALEPELKRRGSAVTYSESFLPGTADFRSLLLKAKTSGPDAVVVLTYPAEGLALVRQARDLGMSKMDFVFGGAGYATEVFEDPVVRSLSSFSILLQRPAADAAAAERRHQIAVAYEKSFGVPLESIDFMTFRAYDAFTAVASAARECSTISSACIRERLYSGGSRPGAFYPMHFDRNGDTPAEFGLYMPVKGEWWGGPSRHQ